MNDRMTANEPCYCVQGNCIDRADTAGCNGKGVTGVGGVLHFEYH